MSLSNIYLSTPFCEFLKLTRDFLDELSIHILTFYSLLGVSALEEVYSVPEARLERAFYSLLGVS